MLCLMSTASTSSFMPPFIAPVDVLAGLPLPFLNMGLPELESAHQTQMNIEALIQRIGLATTLPLDVQPKIESQFAISQYSTEQMGSGTTTSGNLLGSPPTVPQILTPESTSSLLTPITPITTHSLAQFPQSLSPMMDELDVPSTSFSRRQSAPEHSLRPLERAQERRRFSDFSIDALLKPEGHRSSRLEERRGSTGRKQRTIYGLRQTEVLEEAFHTQRYMVGAEREMLAARLGLSEAQVRVWFQNRRSKQRKMNRTGNEHE